MLADGERKAYRIGVGALLSQPMALEQVVRLRRGGGRKAQRVTQLLERLLGRQPRCGFGGFGRRPSRACCARADALHTRYPFAPVRASAWTRASGAECHVRTLCARISRAIERRGIYIYIFRKVAVSREMIGEWVGSLMLAAESAAIAQGCGGISKTRQHAAGKVRDAVLCWLDSGSPPSALEAPVPSLCCDDGSPMLSVVELSCEWLGIRSLGCDDWPSASSLTGFPLEVPLMNN